jgi:phosphate/sulfate permease
MNHNLYPSPQTVFVPIEADPMEAIRQKAAMKRAVGAMTASSCQPTIVPPAHQDICGVAKFAQHMCSATKPKSCVWPWVILLVVSGVLAALLFFSMRNRWQMKVETGSGGLSALLYDKKRHSETFHAESRWPFEMHKKQKSRKSSPAFCRRDH